MRKWALLFLAFTTGCMVGPNYKKPESCMPDAFMEGSQTVLLDEDLNQWWKQFNDPLLDELLEEACRANYDHRIALEKIIQARSEYQVQSSYLWPEFDIDAVATRSRNSQTLFDTGGTNTSGINAGTFLPTFQNFFHIAFDAIWELDFFGKFRRSQRAALYEWEASREEAQDVKISIMSEVARNYVIIRAAQQKIELLKQKIAIYEEELALTSALYESGLDDKIQVDTTVVSLEEQQAVLPTVEATLKQTLYALAFLLGRQPESLGAKFEERKSIPLGLDKIPTGLPSDLLRRRPDIRRAERALAAATEQIGVAVAELFPHITLTGNTFSGGAFAGSAIGFETGSLSQFLKHASQFWSVGPALRWDILDFGKTRGNIELQKSIMRQALLTYEQTVIASLRDVEGALAVYFDEQKRRCSYANEMEASREAFELASDLFQAGLANQQQVLQAQLGFLDSQLSFTDSEQALTTYLIATYKALGGDWECSYTPLK